MVQREREHRRSDIWRSSFPESWLSLSLSHTHPLSLSLSSHSMGSAGVDRYKSLNGQKWVYMHRRFGQEFRISWRGFQFSVSSDDEQI